MVTNLGVKYNNASAIGSKYAAYDNFCDVVPYYLSIRGHVDNDYTHIGQYVSLKEVG